MTKSSAVFLDRDGTIIEDRGYIDDPAKVSLLPGAAEAVRRLIDAEYRIVIVSNQSGIARGLLNEAILAKVHARLEELLAREGARLDGAYYCPYLDGPEAVVEAYRRDSELRKPKPGMLLQAARELDIDLTRSWMVGNSASDVEAGLRAGCCSLLIEPEVGKATVAPGRQVFVARSIEEAAEVILRSGRSLGQFTEMEAGTSRVNRSADGSERIDRVAEVLDRIHDLLERQNRQRRQIDFSILRLLGALLQMSAILSAIWGILGLLNDIPTDAGARLALASFLQLACLSAFVLDRFR